MVQERLAFLEALSDMPEEAFSWFLSLAIRLDKNQGFQEESQKSLKEASEAAKRYIDNRNKP